MGAAVQRSQSLGPLEHGVCHGRAPRWKYEADRQTTPARVSADCVESSIIRKEYWYSFDRPSVDGVYPIHSRPFGAELHETLHHFPKFVYLPLAGAIPIHERNNQRWSDGPHGQSHPERG